MANDTAADSGKVWSSRRVGSATFAISKPKRKRHKLRQTRLKNRRRSR